MLNRIIVSMPGRPWQQVNRATVSVSGFAPKEISGANRYMEWCVPAGEYEVRLYDAHSQYHISCALNHGDAVEIKVSAARTCQWALAATVVLALCLAGLLAAVLVWEFQHYPWLFLATLLLFGAICSWWWFRKKSRFRVDVSKPAN